MAKRALGKGIGALIGETDDARRQAAATGRRAIFAESTKNLVDEPPPRAYYSTKSLVVMSGEGS